MREAFFSSGEKTSISLSERKQAFLFLEIREASLLWREDKQPGISDPGISDSGMPNLRLQAPSPPHKEKSKPKAKKAKKAKKKALKCCKLQHFSAFFLAFLAFGGQEKPKKPKKNH